MMTTSPSAHPSKVASSSPSTHPSIFPSFNPSFNPTSTPSTDMPSYIPTSLPTTAQPSSPPSASWTTVPSNAATLSTDSMPDDRRSATPSVDVPAPSPPAYVDECPDQFVDKSTFRHISIDSFEELKAAIESASDGESLCFKDFNVLVNTGADPIIIDKELYVLCENYSCGIQGGGSSPIFHIQNNGSVTIQGLAFLGVHQAMRIDTASAFNNKICYCSFLRSNATARDSAVEVQKSSVFIGHSNFVGNTNKGVGGAIDNFGVLNVYQSTFEGNEATEAGGAIMSRANATLELSGCAFTANNATVGSAVYIEDGHGAIVVDGSNKGEGHQGCEGIDFQGSGCLKWNETINTTTPMVMARSTTTGTANCDESDEQREIGIMSVLVNASGSIPFQDPLSAQSQAAEWIMNDDARSLCPKDPTLVQRYIMAVFYFGLGGDNWTMCGRSSNNCTDSQGQPLFHHLSSTGECSWAGMRCNKDHRITEIHRDSNNLAGRLSDIANELALLRNLEVLDLDGPENYIFGVLPSTLGKLSKLRILDIDRNRLHGTLPPTLFDLPLEVLDINDNFFSGSISSDIGKLGNSLMFLQLHGNAFYGSIPSELGNCNRLETTTFQVNAFTGAVPQEICSLHQQGSLVNLWADCAHPISGVACASHCCTNCL